MLALVSPRGPGPGAALAAAFARPAAAAALAAALAFARPAPADTLRADLSVERSPEASDCPDAPQLAEAVNRSLGREAAGAEGGPRDVSLRVRFVVDSQGYLAFVDASGRRSGTRRLDDRGPTCAGLAEALALTVALLLDDDAARRSPEPAPAGPPAGPPAAPGAAEAPPPRGRAPAGVGFEAGGLLTSLLARPLGVGVYAEGRVELSPTIALGAGGFWLPSRTFREIEPGRVSFSLLAGTLSACWAPRRPQAEISFGLCARPAAGALSAASSGYLQTNRDVRRFWAAAGASADLSGPLFDGVRWTGRLGGFVPLRGERFAVDEQTVYRASAPAFFVGAGVRATIW